MNYIYKRVANISKTKVNQVQRENWNRVIMEAHNIVGNPKSFWSLKSELNEYANVDTKLCSKIKNSLRKTARTLLTEKQKHVGLEYLIVLLVSKAAGNSHNVSVFKYDSETGVLHSQKIIAECVEILKTYHVLHKRLVHISKSITDNYEHVLFNNKIFLLGGDYVLSKFIEKLSELHNSECLEIMSIALRDQTLSEFVGLRDHQNHPLPAQPIAERKQFIDPQIYSSELLPIDTNDALGNSQSEWKMRHMLSVGSLLARACQSVLKVADHPSLFQEQGYNLGKHLALAHQIFVDRQPFEYEYMEPFSLISLPVMFHLEYDPSLYTQIKKGIIDINNVNFKWIHKCILSGPGLERSKRFQQQLLHNALTILQQFPQSDEKKALVNIAVSLNV